MRSEFLARFGQLRISGRQDHFWLEACKDLQFVKGAYSAARKIEEADIAEDYLAVALGGSKIRVELLKAILSNGSAWRKIYAKARYGRWDSTVPPLRYDILNRIASGTLNLRDPHAQTFILEAARVDDREFFNGLAEALNGKSSSEFTSSSVENVAYFLASFWTSQQGEFPPLCLFSDRALNQLCDIIDGRVKNPRESAALKKWRQRLGLLHPVGVRKVRTVAIINPPRTLSLD